MKTLSLRASVREWSDEELSLQDLSDLLWAANGVNRPEKKMRTAPSPGNAQDIDVYVLMKEGAYLYDAFENMLKPIANGDFRQLRGEQFAVSEPISLLLVSEITRFRMGDQELRLHWAAITAGIVSQNISLFCAATGLGTVPRAGFDKEKVRDILKLKDTQYPILNHPVGHLVK
jgi:SagB-type dehydrogenase family enzyme